MRQFQKEIDEMLDRQMQSPEISIKTECDNCGYNYWVDWNKEEDVGGVIVGNRVCGHCRRNND